MAVTRLTPRLAVFYEETRTLIPSKAAVFSFNRTFIGPYAVLIEFDRPIRAVVYMDRCFRREDGMYYCLTMFGGWSPAEVKAVYKSLLNLKMGINKIIVTNISNREATATVRIVGLQFDTALEAARPGAYVTHFVETDADIVVEFETPGDNRSIVAVITPDKFMHIVNQHLWIERVRGGEWVWTCAVRVWSCAWFNDEVLPMRLGCKFLGCLGPPASGKRIIVPRDSVDAIVFSDAGIRDTILVRVYGDARSLIVQQVA